MSKDTRKQVVAPIFAKAKSRWKMFENKRWSRDEKESVTILLNVVEKRKSLLVGAFMKRLGVRCIDLGTPTAEDAAVGKMYGTPGLCNPVYFNVGQIVRALDRIREETKETRAAVSARYVFVCPSGPCSPCRYGMYSQEYIKAIHDAGFTAFRVITFSADIFDTENEPDDALQFTFEFRINILMCLIVSDAIHTRDVETRPYETHAGETLRVVEEAERLAYQAIESPLYLVKIPAALRRIARLFDAVEVRKQKKPKIFITGEIFANNSNGDANYNIREYCMSRGCEVNPALFSARVFYEFYRRLDQTTRQLKYGDDGIAQRLVLGRFLLRQQLGLELTKRFVQGYFGDIGARLDYPRTKELLELGDRYYNWRVMGGEGNLEVAEAIEQHEACDGFISIKPFGCMPSSGVSDGVMAKVQEVYPDLNFLSIETSGDNETNVLNRVAMIISKAKEKRRKKTQGEAEARRSSRRRRDFVQSPDVRPWSLVRDGILARLPRTYVTRTA